MAEKTSYPPARPISNPPQALNGATNQSFPTTKAQMYGATNRPVYRPHPKPQRHRRSCFCSCFLWTALLLIILILLAAIVGAVLWVLYRPHRPSFSVTTLRISQLKITTTKSSTSHLDSKFDLTLTARNPNKKLVFFYDPFTVSVTSNDIDVGDGSFPSFVHGTKNTTVLRSSVTSKARDLDSSSASTLNSDLKKKTELDMQIQLETKVKVKMGWFKSNKVGIKVTCDGIKVTVQKGKTPSSLSPSSDTKCKVDLRIKILKWTL